MQNKRFVKKRIRLNPGIVNKIAISNVMTDKEKIRFLAFVGYMTEGEQNELSRVV